MKNFKANAPVTFIFLLSISLFYACSGSDDGNQSVNNPTYQIPKTGQTVSYADYDDGAIEYGKSWPDPRFTQLADTSIQDNLTGLIWAPDGNIMSKVFNSFDTDGIAGDGKVTWSHALDYIDLLNSDYYLGHTDWRLPNRKELRSLTNFSTETIPWMESFGFSNLIGDPYKTSTDCGSADQYSSVSYWNGRELNNDKTSFSYVFPVRGTSNYLPKTGQTTSSQSGDDGSLQKGIAWPSPRFTDNLNQTITDELTGLIWAKDANLIKYRDPGFDTDETAGDGEVTWQHAMNYAAKLRSENYLGHNDWRVPNVNEMESLCNASQWDQVSLLEYAGFIHVEADLYWTSTTYYRNTDFAHYFGPERLRIGGTLAKTDCLDVMVVRGGN